MTKYVVIGNSKVKEKDLLDFLKGTDVSVDVSTGEEDAYNRLHGTVDEVMRVVDFNSKNGLILLVTEPEANYEA